jgi:hypothetical protein
MSEQNGVTRLAQIDAGGVVLNVIEAPPGVGPEYATEVLGWDGIWVIDGFTVAGVGLRYDSESCTFSFPETPEESPAE